jgi:sigma-B regulation protein RsbU (phosphoserine phosphatase)
MPNDRDLLVRFPHSCAGRAAPRHVRVLASTRKVHQPLPRELPRVPGWDFAGLCRPVPEVAGDEYGTFEDRAGRVALAPGDVAGKG